MKVYEERIQISTQIENTEQQQQHNNNRYCYRYPDENNNDDVTEKSNINSNTTNKQ